MAIKDLSGQRFGRLVVVRDSGRRTKHRNVIFECLCDCGNATLVSGGSLTSGKVKSCGCYRVDVAKEFRHDPTTHGHSDERLYTVWTSMKQRCYCPSAVRFEHYGARGIVVCDEWLNDYESFRKWALDSGYDETKPKGECTLDRIDVNGNYEPLNCRFVSSQEQNLNKTNNIQITYNGLTQTASEWAAILGISASTIRSRFHAGWTPNEILFGKASI